MNERRALFTGGRDARGDHAKSFGTWHAVCVWAVLWLALCGVAYADEPLYDIDVPASNAAEALNRFAEQTGAILLFPYDVARARQANAVRGRYTLLEGLQRLLQGTGLSGGLSDKRVVSISQTESARHLGEEGAMPKQKTSFGTRIAAFVTSILSVSAARGQDENTRTQTLEEIVVTAQRREELLKDVPISITVLTGRDLDRSTAQGISEELTRVPGVSTFAHTQAGGTIVTVRGASVGSPTFAGSSPVSYYLDSVPFGLVQTAIAPDANAFDLERVEVLRGPQGTLYGVNAQAGVVRVLTKDPDLNNFDLKFRASDSATEGGGNNFRGDLAVNAPISEGKLAARAVVGYQDMSGWIDALPFKEDANDAELTNARIKVSAQPSDQLSIGASAWISRGDYGGLTASDDDARRTSEFDESYSIDYDAYGVKIGYEFPGVSFTSMTSYLDYSSGGVVDARGIFLSPIGLFVGFDADVFAEEINLSSNQDGPWRWTAGAMFRDAKDKNLAVGRTLARPDCPVSDPTCPVIVLDWTNTSKSYALFGELSRRFSDDRFEGTLGVRYFHDDVVSKEDGIVAPVNGVNYYRAEDSFDSTTPRAVLTWHPSPNASVYGSYSVGFRSGTPQSYYTVGGQPGFPPAKPDKLHNYEIGVKGGGSVVGFEAAVYYMDWKDVQQQLTVLFQGAPVAAITNGESASGVGVDLGVTARPAPGLELGANLSWNNLEMDADIFSAGVVLFAKGDRPNFSPEYTAGLFADYDFQLGGGGFRGRVSASGNYTSEQSFRGFSGPLVVPATGDSILVARASFSIQSPYRWDVTIFGDNLNNEGGAVVGNPFFGPDASTRVRPRTVGVQVDYAF